MKTIQNQIGAGTARLQNHFDSSIATRIRPVRNVVLIAALLFLLPGCSISGVYRLVSVNGNKVPARISHEGAVLEVRSGAFTIQADGKCISRMNFVPPSGKEATLERTATYTRDGAKLSMTWEGAGRTDGTVEGDTFTMNNEGMVFVFRK